jgi:hypothetical protein
VVVTTRSASGSAPAADSASPASGHERAIVVAVGQGIGSGWAGTPGQGRWDAGAGRPSPSRRAGSGTGRWTVGAGRGAWRG